MLQKIGFMDFEPILDRFPALVSLRSQIEKKRDELMKLETEIVKLDSTQNMQDMANLQSAKLPLINQYRMFEMEYKNKHSECTGILLNHIKEVAKENEFAAILDIDNMLYSEGLQDVTDLILKKMDLAVAA